MTDTHNTTTTAVQLADVPPRARIHAVAKQFGISSRLLFDELLARGVAVKSASSGVDAPDARSALLALADRGLMDLPSAEPAAPTEATEPSAPTEAVEPAADAEAQPAAPADSIDGPGDQPADIAETRLTRAPNSRPGCEFLSSQSSSVSPPPPHSSCSPSVACRQNRATRWCPQVSPKRSWTTWRRRMSPPSRRYRSQPASDDHEGGGEGAVAGDPTRPLKTPPTPQTVQTPRTPQRRRIPTFQQQTPRSTPVRRRCSARPTANRRRPRPSRPPRESAGRGGGRRRRRRGGRGDRSEKTDTTPDDGAESDASPDQSASVDTDSGEVADGADSDDSATTTARRRRRRRRGGSGDEAERSDDPADTVVHVREVRTAESQVQGVRGSTRLEAKRQRRRESLQTRRRPQILTEAEFLARRESVHRVMAVRQRGELSQVALLEDGVLVEHFVSRAGSASMIGNIYLGRVQNVLPSMEAAFVDIGRGRNAVLYAGEVDWDAAGLSGKSRKIETALGSGSTVLVQVSKDPVGHKGARLTTQISLPGRFLVYVPSGGATGISRKLPDTERKRLKAILDRIVPADAGVIIRTAAEGVVEVELAGDVERLTAEWTQISEAFTASAGKSSSPRLLYSEPDTLIKVVRDLFNSDIDELVIDGDEVWDSVSEYVTQVAPELFERLSRYDGPTDVFAAHRIDEQIAKALERKVFLPSGGSLVIDRTEAMTVIDVNTGKYTGAGGNLEETVTKNNLEAAEEVVRQLRLRDVGGIIVIDFIDMVLESNRDLVLRRLTECLGRDRTRHQVAEVTSLGLVQMTRKKLGTGLLEAFSEPCELCHGRGVLLRDVPVDATPDEHAEHSTDRTGRRRRGREAEPETAVVAQVSAPRRDPRGPRPPSAAADDVMVEDISATVVEFEPDIVVPDGSGGEIEPVLDLTDELMSELNELAIGPLDAGMPTEPLNGLDGLSPEPTPEPAAAETPRRRSGRRRSASRPAGPPEHSATEAVSAG